MKGGLKMSFMKVTLLKVAEFSFLRRSATPTCWSFVVFAGLPWSEDAG
jgi:hypothetical protein